MTSRITLSFSVLLLMLSGVCSARPYQTYDGPSLPADEIATIHGDSKRSWFPPPPNRPTVSISNINGEELSDKDSLSTSFHLKPGPHRIVVWYRQFAGQSGSEVREGRLSVTVNPAGFGFYDEHTERTLNFTAMAGHEYVIRFREHEWPGPGILIEDVDYWIEDSQSGQVFAEEEGKATLSTDEHHFDLSSTANTGRLIVNTLPDSKKARSKYYVSVDGKDPIRVSYPTRVEFVLDAGEHQIAFANGKTRLTREFDPENKNMLVVTINKNEETVLEYKGPKLFGYGQLRYSTSETVTR